jgi:hypothetical protein
LKDSYLEQQVQLERTITTTRTELSSLKENHLRMKAAKKLKKEQIIKSNKV